MRRRRFRRDIPGAALPPASISEPAPAPPARRKASYRRKRLVALAVVVLVSISIPVLAFTLIFTR
jgi:hypothetical protein